MTVCADVAVSLYRHRFRHTFEMQRARTTRGVCAGNLCQRRIHRSAFGALAAERPIRKHGADGPPLRTRSSLPVIHGQPVVRPDIEEGTIPECRRFVVEATNSSALSLLRYPTRQCGTRGSSVFFQSALR